jgi:hypothetical protein
MTKQHFISLADTIKQDLTTFTPDVIESLSWWLSQQNPRFNRILWLNYIAGKVKGA